MPEIDLILALLNQPGQPGFAPLRLIAGFFLIVAIVS